MIPTLAMQEATCARLLADPVIAQHVDADMALPTFSPPMRPGPGTGHPPEISLRKASFGDGYTLALPAGLNYIWRIVTLPWNFLTLTEVQEIEVVLVLQGGHRPFLYSLNGETTPRKWTCSDWNLADHHPTQVTATLKTSALPPDPPSANCSGTKASRKPQDAR